MAIDASIYSQLLRPPKSVAEYDAEAIQLQLNRLALQMGQTQFADRARAIEDGNRLRQVVSGFGGDQTANYNALLSAGRLDEAQKYVKSNADIAKVAADAKQTAAQAGEVAAKTVGIKLGQAKDVLNTMQSADQAADWVRGMYSDPDLAPVFAKAGDTAEAAISRIPTDPKAFQQWKMQASLGADKLIEYTTPTANTVANNQTSIANNAATNATSRANNAASNAVTMRGQNLTDNRAKQALIAGRVPAGYRANADGSLSFIPGGPADPAALNRTKPPTEFQGKSAIFGARAEEADKIISGLKYSPSAINTKTSLGEVWGIGGALGAMANASLSPNDQKADQAQRDFINAVLRQESGAAIGEGEFDNARKQYFPQPNDKPENIKQKERARKLAVEGLKRNAGNAAFSAPEQEPVSKAGVPSMGTSLDALLDKYKD